MDKDNPQYASQEDVYNAIGLQVLENAFDGYNASVFAYGQTGKNPFCAAVSSQPLF